VKKGEIVGVVQAFGGIELVRFHSEECDKYFNVYLSFDMGTEHTTVQEYSRLMPKDMVLKVLQDD